MFALLDCNSFYCSCERLFRPELDNRPVVVLSNNDGCVIARSDEAKAAGIKMGSPFFQCKDLIREKKVAVFSSNYTLYGELSLRVMDTIRTILGSEKVEVYSVDEAFLNLSEIPAEMLENFARSLRETVEQWTGIKVSIGVAPTKVLCKVANRLSKKNKSTSGCVLVINSEDRILEALEQTAVDEIWGVGYKYAEKLKQWGIDTALKLSSMPPEWARKNLGGVVGIRLVKELNGEPCIEMKDPLEKKKMITSTRMFGKPVHELTDLREAVATYTARAAEKLRRQKNAAGIIQVFLVTSAGEGFSYHPKQFSLEARLLKASSLTNELISYAMPLVNSLYKKGPRYLKAGVLLSELVPEETIQGNLFKTDGKNKLRNLMLAIDNINFSQRNDMVKYATTGISRRWKMRQDLKSPRYTTSWNELKIIS
jgi:DNA polymerase V